MDLPARSFDMARPGVAPPLLTTVGKMVTKLAKEMQIVSIYIFHLFPLTRNMTAQLYSRNGKMRPSLFRLLFAAKFHTSGQIYMTNDQWLKCKIRGVGNGVPLCPITLITDANATKRI